MMPKLLNNPAPTFGTNLASITGVIKDVVDYNESNGFTVCIIRATDVVPTIDTRVRVFPRNIFSSSPLSSFSSSPLSFGPALKVYVCLGFVACSGVYLELSTVLVGSEV